MFGQWMGDNRIDLELGNKESIERLNQFKTIKVLYGNTFAMHLEQLNQLQNDIETVLNLIQTQQAEIDSLKDFKEIAESKVTDLNPIGLARTNQLLSRQCHKLQEESEKKDKIIKELEEKLSERNMEKH